MPKVTQLRCVSIRIRTQPWRSDSCLHPICLSVSIHLQMILYSERFGRPSRNTPWCSTPGQEGRPPVGIMTIRSSRRRACPLLLSCCNHGNPDQSWILGAQNFSPDGTHLLIMRRVPTLPQGEKGFLEDGAGGLASSGSLSPSTHLQRPCRIPGEGKRFPLLTPGSRLSENHSWLSQSALPLADQGAGNAWSSKGEGSATSSSRLCPLCARPLPQGGARPPCPTAAPASPERSWAAWEMSRVFRSSLRAERCAAEAESCSEPASGTSVSSLGVGPDGVRKMCGSQVVTWPLLVLFTRTCLSLSDSTPVTWPMRAPGLGGPRQWWQEPPRI